MAVSEIETNIQNIKISCRCERPQTCRIDQRHAELLSKFTLAVVHQRDVNGHLLLAILQLNRCAGREIIHARGCCDGLRLIRYSDHSVTPLSSGDGELGHTSFFLDCRKMGNISVKSQHQITQWPSRGDDRGRAFVDKQCVSSSPLHNACTAQSAHCTSVGSEVCVLARIFLPLQFTQQPGIKFLMMPFHLILFHFISLKFI